MSQVDLDFAFIQFYNNFCSIDKQFNWDTWSDYASGKNIKLYLGIAGSSSSAGSGYVDLSTVQDTISKIKNDGSFGGVSIWDISSVPDQYIEGINSALEGSASTPTTNSVSDVYSTSGNTLSTSAPSPTAYTPVTSAPASTTSSTTTNAFLNWINGFFSQLSQALQASQAPTSAATAPTTPSLATQAAPTTTNWFGDLFASEVTTYVTITTTVASSILKRDIIVDSEATNFHPGYLIVVTFISILFII